MSLGNNWLSVEVATELGEAPAKLQLSVEAVALLSAVVEARSFRSLYGDRADSPRLWRGALDAFPPLDQIGGTGPGGLPTHTFGAWQWEPETAKEIATGIGTSSVTPVDQIKGSWWLAQRDYKARSDGADLATDLVTAGHDRDWLEAIAAKLRSTWPGGTRMGFAARYLSALPGAQPPQGPDPVEIPLGERCTLAILSATDRSGVSIPAAEMPVDLLKPDDPTICSVMIDKSGAVIDALALGTTTLRGADQAIAVTVVQRIVAHLQLDLAHPVFMPIAVVMRAAALSALSIFPLIGMGSPTAIEPAPQVQPFSWERNPPTFRMMPDLADPLGQRLIVETISK